MSNLSQPSPEKKQAQSQGGGVPQWLAALGIDAGSFFIASKASRGAVARDPSRSEKDRVAASVSLHTWPFGKMLFESGPPWWQTDGSILAVKLVGGQLRPWRSSDIAGEAEMESRQVRRALVDLEQDGYLIRDGQGVREWAIPHNRHIIEPVQPEDEPEIVLSGDLPADLARYMRRLHASHVPDDPEIVERVKTICFDLGAAEKRSREVQAQSRELLSQLRRILIPEPETQGGQPRPKTRTDSSSHDLSGSVSTIKTDKALHANLARARNDINDRKKNKAGGRTTMQEPELSEPPARASQNDGNGNAETSIVAAVLAELHKIQDSFPDTPLGRYKPPDVNLAYQIVSIIGAESAGDFFAWINWFKFKKQNRTPQYSTGPEQWGMFVRYAEEFRDWNAKRSQGA